MYICDISKLRANLGTRSEASDELKPKSEFHPPVFTNAYKQ
jgi:hypothetical protein